MREPKPMVEIVSMGRYLPDRVLTNHDLEEMLDTSDEWIRNRTGIRERRIADDATTPADMGAEAARRAMEKTGVKAGEVDILIVATVTPDRWLPSTACDIQSRIGCTNAASFDIMAACSGFLYGLSMAEGYLVAGRGEIALVVSAEKMSSIVDWSDRSTCVLFGDGAGAAVVRASEGEAGILSSYLRSDGRLSDILYRPAGGAAVPLDAEGLERGDHLVKMKGREVFKNAVREMAEASDMALKQAGLTPEDVTLLVPHQANIRIIEATARYAGVPLEKVYVNLDRFGNMSSATVPIALDEARECGRIEPGDHVLLTAFGAGLTWGAMALRF